MTEQNIHFYWPATFCIEYRFIVINNTCPSSIGVLSNAYIIYYCTINTQREFYYSSGIY